MYFTRLDIVDGGKAPDGLNVIGDYLLRRPVGCDQDTGEGGPRRLDSPVAHRPPADPTWGDRRGRLHKAMDLLRDAHNEVSREEDDRAARGFKKRALFQIDNAARDTNAAMHAWNF